MDAPSYVFESAARRIVEFKWDNAMVFVNIEAFTYLFFAILLVIDTWYFCASRNMKWIILTYNCLLMIKSFAHLYLFTTFKCRRECSYHIEFEGWNLLKHNFKEYFKNMFNLFDLCGQTLVFIYCIMFLVHHGED